MPLRPTLSTSPSSNFSTAKWRSQMLGNPGTLRSGRFREVSTQYRSTCNLLQCVGSRFLRKITRHFRHLSFAILATVCRCCAAAQDSGAAQSGWYVYNGDHPVTPKWAIHLEGEWRRTPFLVQPEQRLLKTGVQRKFDVGWTALIGYTYVVNTPPDDSTRVWARNRDMPSSNRSPTSRSSALFNCRSG